MPLKIIRNDLTQMKVNAIVNPTNKYMYGTAGVDGMIHKKEGSWLKKETEKLRPLLPGEVKITKAKKLPSKYIIHTVGPIWDDDKKGKEKILISCYKKSLDLAIKRGFKSIAFPLIATGTYGYPKDKALGTAVSTISKFLLKNEIDVYLVVYDVTSFKLSNKLQTKIDTYIDNNYVKENNLYKNKITKDRLLKVDSNLKEEKNKANKNIDFYRSLDDLFENLTEPFSDMLIRLIDEKGYTCPDVYKRANVSRQTFSKIRNKEKYKPTKETVIALAIGLKLNYDETIDFLKSAGYALSNNKKFDLIIKYFIENQNYNINKINIVLFKYTENTIGI